MTKKEADKPQNIYEAFLAAQAEFPEIPKDKTNPHFKSRYSSLDAIQSACWPVLHKYGLVPRYATTQLDGQLIVWFEIIHALSGEKLTNSLQMPTPPDVQKMGSALTYMRRYACTAGLGVCSDEDDDGNGASRNNGGNGQPKRNSPPAQQAAPVRSALSANQQRTQDAVKNGEAWIYRYEKPATQRGESDLHDITTLAKKQGAIRTLVTTDQGEQFYKFACFEPLLDLKGSEIGTPKSLDDDCAFETHQAQPVEQ